MARVELARRAQRDLRALGKADRGRARRALEALAAGAENLDTKPLAVRPWMRLRAGNFRILYRQHRSGYLVARVVNRADLERALRSL